MSVLAKIPLRYQSTILPIEDKHGLYSAWTVSVGQLRVMCVWFAMNVVGLITSTVSLAGVFVCSSSTKHVGADLIRSVVSTVIICQDIQLDLSQVGGLLTVGAEFSPTSHGGLGPNILVASILQYIKISMGTQPFLVHKLDMLKRSQVFVRRGQLVSLGEGKMIDI